jgi:hypothetical protein
MIDDVFAKDVHNVYVVKHSQNQRKVSFPRRIIWRQFSSTIYHSDMAAIDTRNPFLGIGLIALWGIFGVVYCL